MVIEGAAEIDNLNPAVCLTALRIAQEALTNAAKHAQNATKATVHLKREGSWLTLTISDDGMGFEVGAAGTGIGLVSMRERAEDIGGTFSVVSSPGGGVIVTATLPTA